MPVKLHTFAESESGSGEIEDYYDVHAGAINLDKETSNDDNSSFKPEPLIQIGRKTLS